MNAPDPNYDLRSALEASNLGYVIQREQLDAAEVLYAANNYQPLSVLQIQTLLLAQAQAIEAAFDAKVLGVIIPPSADPYPDSLPPTYPSGLPRFPDSNEDPFDGWTQFGEDQQGYDFR